MNSDYKQYPGELNHEESITFIQSLADFNVPVLLFSGGEPLIRPDFFELAAEAARLGIRPTLSTNGTLITRDIARRLKQIGVGYVGISWMGWRLFMTSFARKKALSGRLFRESKTALLKASGWVFALPSIAIT